MRKLLSILSALLTLPVGWAFAQNVGGLAGNGSVTAGNPVWVCGSDGTDCRAIATDSSGRLILTPTTSFTVNGVVAISPAAGVSAFTVTATGSPASVVIPAGNVTTTGSPATVICLSGCASSGPSPSTVVIAAGNITNTVLVSPSGAISVYGTVAISPVSNIGVVQGTSPWAINGNVGITQTNSVTPLTVVNSGTFTITASGSPTSVICITGCASSGASPSAVTVTAGNITNTVNVSPTGAQSIYGTVAVSPISNVGVVQGTSPWAINGNVGITQTNSVTPLTVVNSGTFTTTAAGSPTSVVCIVGCASAGASPSSVLITAGNITNTVNVSPTGAQSIYGTVAVSPIGNIGVVQGTSPWAVNGNVGITQTNSVTPLTVINSGTFNITASGSPTSVVCIVGCASAGASPSAVTVTAGNITNTVTTSLNNSITIAGTPVTSLNNSVTIAGTPTVSLNGTGLVVALISPYAGASAFTVTATGSPATAIVANTVATSVAGTGLTSIAGTVITSPVAQTIPVSLTGAVSVYGNISASGSPASVVIAAPATLNTSINGVATVTCVSNCATGGVSPQTVIISAGNITNTVTTSLNNSVTIAGTPTVSPGVITALISPAVGTSAFIVSMSTGLSLASTTVVSIAGTALNSLAGTVITSPVAQTIPVSLTGAVSVFGGMSLASATIPVSATGIVAESQIGTGYISRAQWVTGNISIASNLVSQLFAAPAAGKVYITGIQCMRDDTSTTAMYIGFTTSASNGNAVSNYIVLPNSGGGGGNNVKYDPPLNVGTGASVAVQASVPVTTIRCSGQGFNAP